MPDYEFGRLYEQPIKKLVTSGEVLEEYAESAFRVLQDVVQFHHEVLPIIYATNNWLTILYCAKNYTIGFSFLTFNTSAVSEKFFIKTLCGDVIVGVDLDKIGTVSLKSLLIKFVGAQ